MQALPIHIGLFGYGSAGKAVAHEIVNAPDMRLSWVVTRSPRKRAQEIAALGAQQDKPLFLDSSSRTSDDIFEKHPVDFIIDFSSGDSVTYYGETARRTGTGIVSAISHYTRKQTQYLNSLAQDCTVLYSPNITLGINFIMVASEIMKSLAPQADIAIIEEHFMGKSGVSGTALRMAKALELDPDKQVKSVRAGGIIGKHEVIFGLPHQTIRLTHDSIGKNAFGSGAIYAIRRLKDLQKGFYTMDQLIREEFRSLFS